MKNLILIFLGVLVINGCTSQKKIMNSWIGSTKQSLIQSWGPPARTASDGGSGEILIYAKQVYLPQFSANYYDYSMFYVDNKGVIYHWITKTESIPPTQIDLNIYKRF